MADDPNGPVIGQELIDVFEWVLRKLGIVAKENSERFDDEDYLNEFIRQAEEELDRLCAESGTEITEKMRGDVAIMVALSFGFYRDLRSR